MLIIGLGGALLAAALVALLVGLLAGSGGWLIASLVCTALAAVLLVVQLRAGRSRSPVDRTVADADGDADADMKAAVDPETAAAATPSGVDDLPVWVIDGEPDYHRPHCEQLTGADAESVPRRQAVEDGFSPCALCRPSEG